MHRNKQSKRKSAESLSSNINREKYSSEKLIKFPQIFFVFLLIGILTPFGPFAFVCKLLFPCRSHKVTVFVTQFGQTTKGFSKLLDIFYCIPASATSSNFIISTFTASSISGIICFILPVVYDGDKMLRIRFH